MNEDDLIQNGLVPLQPINYGDVHFPHNVPFSIPAEIYFRYDAPRHRLASHCYRFQRVNDSSYVLLVTPKYTSEGRISLHPGRYLTYFSDIPVANINGGFSVHRNPANKRFLSMQGYLMSCRGHDHESFREQDLKIFQGNEDLGPRIAYQLRL